MREYVDALRKYVVFSGRASRRDYWMFYLWNLIFAITLGVVDAVLRSARVDRVGWLGLLYGLAVIIPHVAVLVRRLHDSDRSGHWIWIVLVPIAGPIVLLVFLVTRGQLGANRFGADPKSREVAVPTPVSGAGWFADPTHRHELRYWDGRAWTDNVSDAGIPSTDLV